MSDTPRTDAEYLNTGHQNWNQIIDFARQLERELNETKEQLAQALNPVHSCSNQCQRPACRWRRVADALAEDLTDQLRGEYGYMGSSVALDAYNKLKGEQK